MNLRAVIIAAVLSVVYSKATKDDTACDKCSGNCSIVPPAGASKYPCYQGTAADTKDCFNNDILINSDATWECGNCADFGYPSYLRNDPIYRKMGLYTTEKEVAQGSNVCKCNNNCSLLPPSGSSSKFPCYQGTASDAAFCFNTDPILPEGTTWVCGECATHGYPTYLQNDPIYDNMGLWAKESSK